MCCALCMISTPTATTGRPALAGPGRGSGLPGLPPGGGRGAAEEQERDSFGGIYFLFFKMYFKETFINGCGYGFCCVAKVCLSFYFLEFICVR
jgi:hypothetical protein